MKKIVSLALALLLCASILASSLQTVCLAAEPDPTPTPTAAAGLDPANEFPGGETHETTE